MTVFRNGYTLINKFHPPIENNPQATAYLTKARQRFNVDNVLANTAKTENLKRRRATVQSNDCNHPHLNSFPRLAIGDLKMIALGTYELKQARSYYGEHVHTNGT